jgi:hypothetical protein
MQLRKLSTTLAMLAATAGVTVFAASAQAVVVDNDAPSLTSDSEVKLTDANLAFDFSGGLITPKLTATLEVDDGDDACYRARLASYDRDGTLLHDKPGITRCLSTDAHREFAINLPEDPDALTDSVVVSVEKDDGPQNSWTTKDERDENLNVFSDSFRIFGSGVGIGGSTWAAGAPATNAVVGWSIDDGLATATYSGYYHFEGFSRCGRVKLRMLDETGTQVEPVNGPQHCPPDLDHYSYQDVLASTPSGDVVEAEVVMQTKSGGQWNDVDSELVSIAE